MEPDAPAPPGALELYAEPQDVRSPAGCRFYHTIKIPGVGLVRGEWDLRGRERRYLGGVELRGRRVLELGTANGALCFWMESQGAQVVAFDLAADEPWDRVPYAGDDPLAIRAQEREHVEGLHRAYWLAHRALSSRARVVHGSVYRVPEAIGQVDIATFGSILLHLREPFRALESAARLCREAVVVTDVIWPRRVPRFLAHRLARRRDLTAGFLPRAALHEPRHTWWSLTPDLVAEMVAILGFPHVHTTLHLQRHQGRRQLLYTVVGRRSPSG